MTDQPRPPFIYYGAKTTLGARIAALLPEHRQYVEPYGGSLAVLLAKPPARLETVNDLDGDLMLFWRVLRDRPDELAVGVGGGGVAGGGDDDDGWELWAGVARLRECGRWGGPERACVAGCR